MARGDSFVVETNVHFPADISNFQKTGVFCQALNSIYGTSHHGNTLSRNRDRYFP